MRKPLSEVDAHELVILRRPGSCPEIDEETVERSGKASSWQTFAVMTEAGRTCKVVAAR